MYYSADQLNVILIEGIDTVCQTFLVELAEELELDISIIEDAAISAQDGMEELVAQSPADAQHYAEGDTAANIWKGMTRDNCNI